MCGSMAGIFRAGGLQKKVACYGKGDYNAKGIF